ncbi:OmpA family protein [Solilutibacter silvestris]|uniref:OmpA family protein n=1 Tax=Solilutibacter silvestris TaxID=1645665 RepID=UPI003D352062
MYGTDTDTVTPVADLVVTKTNNVNGVTAGQPTTYTITVTNNGPSASTATVTDPVATGLTKTATACSATPGVCTTAPTIAGLEGAGVVTPSIPSGGTYQFTVTANVTATSGSVTNSATAQPPAGTTDPTPGNNTGTDTDTVTPVADVQITKTATTAAVPGQPMTWSITVKNNGPSDAAGVTTSDNVPAEVTGLTLGGADAGACTVSGQTVSCNFGTVTNGATKTYTVTGLLASSATGNVVNTATVATTTTDPTPGNNTSTTTTPTAASADLALVKTLVSPSPATTGSTVTYKIVVTNAGPSDVTGAVISDTVPAELTGVTWTCAANGSATCGAASGSGNAISLTGSIVAGSGNNLTIMVTGTAPSTTPSTIAANIASVSPPAGTTDPTPGNNTSTVPPVPVSAFPIVANADTYTGINGATGATTASTIVNDTLNGVVLTTADIGTKVTLTPGAAPTTTSGGLVMNADGTITVKPGTPAGTYVYPYTICEKLNPTNCSTANATVTVSAAPIAATNDTGTANGATGGQAIATVLTNDTLNGAPATTSTVTITVAAGSTVPAVLTFDTTTGAVDVKPSTPAGTYTFNYTICEKLNPSNCSTATATVTVSAAPIVANPDSYTGINGATGTPNAGNAYANDTLNGQPVNVSQITGSVVTPATSINGGPVPSLDPATGTVSVPAGTPAGDYQISYKICEKLNPTNCSTTTIDVKVTAAPIDAVDDNYSSTPINGINGGSTPTVLANDTLNGQPVKAADVTLTPGTAPTTASGGIVMNADGTITVKPNTPAGTYTYSYKICEKLNPTNCDTANATVVVSAAPIVATPDSYPGINGATGNPNAGNAYGNDTLNGQPVDPAKIVGTVVTPATSINGGPVPSLDPATGTVSVPAGTPAGDYQISYKICEKLNPTNCSTTTIDVKVVAAPIVAKDDSSDPINGGNGGSTPSVLANDTLNGQPATTTTVTLKPGTAPATTSGGIVMNADGTITVKPGTPAGDYSYPYTICEKLNPTNCATATATVKVTAPVIVANPDAAPAMPAVDSTTGGNTPSVIVNDTLNGVALTTGDIGTKVTLTPGTSPNPSLSMNPDGTITVKPGAPAGTYVYPYTICDRINPTNCANTTATVVVTAPASMRVTKTAQPSNVHVGDLVRYTLTIENTGSVPVNGATLVDTPPAGFSYVEKSMTVVDRDNKANMIAIRSLTVSGIDIDVGQRAVVTYMLRVGAGVHPGTYTNQALMQDRGRDASNVATANVQVVGDPMTDDSLILGTVFDDRDGDGWQDSADASGLKVQGGFSPDAYIANSTTVDHGDGPKPEADHSSPMLHGIPLGELKGRQSDADPVSSHQVVIRQRLRELAFNDDFVLTSKEGVTVRMDAAGKTRVETSGDAAKGLNAVDLKVERKVAQDAQGYVVDYVISNAGVDERGIPGVRIASVEGLLVETDQFGRYHIAAIDGGGDRGRNFILKVDPSTLPPGTTFTTDNPLVRRLTPGLPVRFDFGVKLPQAVIEGETSLTEMQLGEVFFAPGSAEIRAQYKSAIEQVAAGVREHKGAEVVINANGENGALAYARALAMKEALLAALDPESAKALVVNTRTDMEDPATLVAGVDAKGTLLGTVLFDTDKSDIRPEFGPLLDAVAAGLEKRGGGVIALVGHTDVRASHAYNTALGMRRAKAVYEALAKRLSTKARANVRVETKDDPTAPVDVKRGNQGGGP